MNATNNATRSEYLSAAQKSLQTTMQRGETLFADGYTIEPYADRPGVYSVARSENDPRPVQSGDTLWNDVDVCNGDCTCKAFQFHGTCKHLVATMKIVANAARLMAPLMPVMSQSSQDKPMRRGFGSPEALRIKPTRISDSPKRQKAGETRTLPGLLETTKAVSGPHRPKR